MNDLELDLENLLFDLDNPRFNGLSDQRAALQEIVSNQGDKLWKLAQDIAQQGLNPTERVSVITNEKSDKHIVVEGNRRLAASKLLCNPARLDDMDIATSLKVKIKKLALNFDSTLVDPMPCVLFDSREEANHWIELRHTGENDGAGIVPWDGQATARFRGNNSSFQVLEFVRAKGALATNVDAQMENFPITNLDRLLGDPDGVCQGSCRVSHFLSGLFILPLRVQIYRTDRCPIACAA
ncbi:ParB/Srx family N-terminal domain-containing protein [Acidithiobacillus sulfuriphilus]|uniref:ParB/Srx family N-terminal domain-containing protein n=1 Tax=Acidithiobacillus sulfuriphilus TaxID=1867749 RepID=A0ACD5HTB7_9PROT